MSCYTISGVAKGSVDTSLGVVDTIRLRVLSQSESWVILSEVSINAARLLLFLSSRLYYHEGMNPKFCV